MSNEERPAPTSPGCLARPDSPTGVRGSRLERATTAAEHGQRPPASRPRRSRRKNRAAKLLGTGAVSLLLAGGCAARPPHVPAEVAAAVLQIQAAVQRAETAAHQAEAAVTRAEATAARVEQAGQQREAAMEQRTGRGQDTLNAQEGQRFKRAEGRRVRNEERRR